MEITFFDLVELCFNGYPEILIFDCWKQEPVIGIHIAQRYDGPTETRLLPVDDFIKASWADDLEEWQEAAIKLAVSGRFILYAVML